MKSSFSTILKANILIGGSSAVAMAFRLVISKWIAYKFGPGGTGFYGTLQSVIQVNQSIFSFGIGEATVRFISTARTLSRRSLVAKASLWISVISGIVGIVAMTLTSIATINVEFLKDLDPVSIAMCGLVSAINIIFLSRIALIQGLNLSRILATITVLTSVISTAIGALIFLFIESYQILTYLLVFSVVQLILTQIYVGKIELEPNVQKTRVMPIAKEIIDLGFSFMGVTFLSSIVSLYTKVIILKWADIETLGLYQAGYTLSGIFVGLVLQAMSKDFFPRLTSATKQEDKNEVLNSQIVIGIVISMPAIVLSVLFSEYLVELFYSDEFAVISGPMRYLLLGSFFRVVFWPLSYVLAASKNGRSFLYFELISSVILGILLTFCFLIWGLTGLCVAFLCANVINGLLILGIIRRLYSFKLSKRTISSAVVSIVFISVLVFLSNIEVIHLNVLSNVLIFCGSILFSVFLIKWANG